MNKWFYSCPDLDTFKTLKLSTDKTNTEYITYNNNIQIVGTPDIKWEQIVFILEECCIYCQGKIIYDFSELKKIFKVDEEIISQSFIELNDRIKDISRRLGEIESMEIDDHNLLVTALKNSEQVHANAIIDMNMRIKDIEVATGIREAFVEQTPE